MDVSIIIVNYNTKELTSQCIDSIYEKTSGVSYEIILVDNASKDGSKEFFEKDPRVIYIYIVMKIWGLVEQITKVQNMRLENICSC